MSHASCLLIRYVSIRSVCRRMNTLLGSILRYVQPTHNGPPRKPDIIPLSSPEEVECFETVDDKTYSEVVQYFRYVGGFSLKAAVDFCLKEAFIDDVTSSFTWFGRTGQRPLYNTRITWRFTVRSNKHLHVFIHNYANVLACITFSEQWLGTRISQSPSDSDFQASMQRALWTTKERVRSKKRGPRATAASTDLQRRRDFWSDQQPEEEADDL